jgi:UDP-N-acetylmuramyl pentapeptide phosphotransferase/UDP-N-acetylglucosamine-1-phosphate transferase
MSAILIAFLACTLCCLALIRYQRFHFHFSADHDLDGVQKFHQTAVPRIGGLAIYLGLALALLYRWAENREIALFSTTILLCALPCFLIGLAEDLTKRIGVKERLFGAFLSAGLCGYFFNAWLGNVQIFGVDTFLSIPVISIFFTCFCVAGVSNSFNLIDGYHGLSSVVAATILLAIAYVAFQVADTPIMVCAFAGVGAILGFLIWNYPKGLIFLGDGGAYLIGFWVAELSILLVLRNEQVSKWFPLLLCFYPIFETLFTIYRRLILKRTSPGIPDATHLHQVIYKRVVRWAIGTSDADLLTQRNAMTAPYLWILSCLAVIPALLFWRYHIALKICAALFALTYIWLYWAIVRFHTPKWLLVKKIVKPNDRV